MTWRQGSNLKLEYLQYDAVFDSAVMRAGDLDAAMGALRAAAGQPDLTLDQTLIQTATFSGGQCFYVDGEDYRTSATDLVPALAKELDGKAKGLPDETSPHWPAMRLLKFYAADFEKRDYDQLNFNDGGTPSAALAGATKLTPGHRTWAIDRMAETLARAIGIPCIAIRDKTVQAPVEEVVKDAPKSKITCHVIRSMVEEEEL